MSQRDMEHKHNKGQSAGVSRQAAAMSMHKKNINVKKENLFCLIMQFIRQISQATHLSREVPK